MKYPAVNIAATNPEVAAVISKLMTPAQRPKHDEKGNRVLDVPAINNFNEISQAIAEKAHDADSIMQLFPDMELSAQILISSIISPKDMGAGEITYSVPPDLLFGEVVAPLLTIVKSYFTKDYKIEPLLPKILRQVLFESGSYPIAVIPESSLDEFINGGGVSHMSSESISDFIGPDGTPKQLNVLGPNNGTTKVTGRGWAKFATENYSIAREAIAINPTIQLSEQGASPTKGATDLINVYDNPFILKFSQLAAKERLNAVSESIRNLSAVKVRPKAAVKTGPDKTRLNDAQLTSLVYKQKYATTRTLLKIKTSDQTKRENIGAPLVITLTSESVIPVFTPGHEEEHVGYFILIDPEGNPVSGGVAVDHFGSLQNRLQQVNANMSSYLLEKAKNAFSGIGTDLNNAAANRIFADVIEADLLARLRNGIYGQNIALGRNDNLYRLMFSRVLANQHTNLLYVPSELITYFAYRYDKQGIGKSLMEDSRILFSLRATLLFSRVMASVKNSIGRTNVKLKLDADDPDPRKTIEITADEVTRTRQQQFPLGLNSPSDLVDWIQRAAYEFTFEGHPGIPDTSLEFEEKNSNYVKPDQELDDELKKRAIQTFGLSPEMVDNGFNAEFAYTAMTQNVLLAKRVTQIQEVFVPQLSDHARKVALNDGRLVMNLKKSVKKDLQKIRDTIDKDLISPEILDDDDQLIGLVVSEFLSCFELELPRPDSSTLTVQKEAFDIYEEAVEASIKYIISAEIMGADFAGEQISQKAEEFRIMAKAHFMRKWMKENGYMTELFDLVENNEEGKPAMNVLEMQDAHVAALVRAGINLLNKSKPVANAADVDVATITGGDGVNEGGTSSSSFSTSSDGGGNMGGFGGEFDDMGGEFGGFDDTLDGGGTGGGNEDDQQPAEDEEPEGGAAPTV